MSDMPKEIWNYGQKPDIPTLLRRVVDEALVQNSQYEQAVKDIRELRKGIEELQDTIPARHNSCWSDAPSDSDGSKDADTCLYIIEQLLKRTEKYEEVKDDK